MNQNKKSYRRLKSGFTLMEVLVVVLIIGILAAAALPQYQKAVKKSRLAAMLPLIKSVAVSEDRFYMANGRYTADFSELDITLPPEYNMPGSYPGMLVNSEQTLLDIHSRVNFTIYNPVWKVGAEIYPSYSTFSPSKAGKTYCIVPYPNYNFDADSKAVCESLGGKYSTYWLGAISPLPPVYALFLLP